MGKIKFELGGLQKLLIVHENALKNKNVKRFDDKGKLHDVPAATKKKAIDALDAASKALSEICQQPVLAIEVEPDPDPNP